MMDSEDVAFMRAEIKRQVQIILFGTTGNTTPDAQTEDIQQMTPGMTTITSRPVMHPYGFASRAPTNTLSVVTRCGDHAGNRMVMGHRDAKKPAVANPGESAQYSAGGYVFRCQNGKVTVEKNGEVETFVVGDTLSELLGQFLQAIAIHTHAAPGTPPTNAVTFTDLKENFVDNKMILAEDGGRY